MITLVQLLTTVHAFLFIPSLGIYEPLQPVPIVDYCRTGGPVVTCPEDQIGHQYDTSQLGDGLGYLVSINGVVWSDTDHGRFVIVGHNTGVFGTLRSIQDGAEVILYTDFRFEPYYFYVQGRYKTSVANTGVLLSNSDVLELVLMTCWDNDERMFVRLYQGGDR